MKPEQPVYEASNLVNPWSRPVFLPNLWISEPTDFTRPEWIILKWDEDQRIRSVELLFDNSIDSSLSAFRADGNCAITGFDFNVLPSLVREYRISVKGAEGNWRELTHIVDNYMRQRVHAFDPIDALELKLEILGTNGIPRAQIYSVRVY
jgi:hypothetical protein